MNKQFVFQDVCQIALKPQRERSLTNGRKVQFFQLYFLQLLQKSILFNGNY